MFRHMGEPCTKDPLPKSSEKPIETREQKELLDDIVKTVIANFASKTPSWTYLQYLRTGQEELLQISTPESPDSTGISKENGDFGENAPVSISTAGTSSTLPNIHSEPEFPPTIPQLQSISQDLYAETMHPIPLLKLRKKRKRKIRDPQTPVSDELKNEFVLICAFCETVPRFTSSKAFQWHHDANHAEMGSPVIKCSRCRDRSMLSIEQVQTHVCREP